MDGNRTLSQRDAFDAPWMRRAPIIAWSEPSGPAREKELHERIVIGTAPSADVVLSDRAVSRLHAELDPRDDGLWVRDLGSRNGTFVEGIRVVAANLPHGAKLQLGRTEITVRYREQASPVELWPSERFGGLVGASVAMRELFAKLSRVAQSSASVLIEGETGTGKELAAKAIHDASPRASGPFVVIDCAALPETLLEAELFGHAKGAFTGALTVRPGAFEEAEGGTVFLDEIGELPLSMQPKLLRVLESRTVRRIGETQHRAVDVRFISATHRDLRMLANNRAFREDLYFRIAVLPLTMPALRERAGDIPLLIDHLLSSEEARVISPDLMRDLASRPWFGNVRELRNFVERATTLGAPEALALTAGATPRIDEDEWRPELPQRWLELSLREFRQQVSERADREYLARLLERCGQNVARAATAAGVNRTYLYRVLSKQRQ